MQTWGLQWNMLSGNIPDSWRYLRAKTIWFRPGNYQLCGGKPANASFELCKEVDGRCELLLLACLKCEGYPCFMVPCRVLMYRLLVLSDRKQSLQHESEQVMLSPGEDLSTLGEVCSLEIPATPRMMPPPTANPTMLEVSTPAQLA